MQSHLAPRSIGIVVLLASTLAACSFFRTPIEEQIELATEGESRMLRDELRPIRGETRVLVFAIDGFGQSEFRNAIDSGGAPNIRKLVGEARSHGEFERAYMASEALSILPSTTMAAWGSIYTGQPVAHTGVPGNEWFERKTGRFVAPAPVSVSDKEDTLQMLNDGLVGDKLEVQTVFERADVRSHVSLAPIYRGADIYTLPGINEVVPVFIEVAQGVVGEETIDREVYSEVDYDAAETAIDMMQAHGIPDLQVVYFPGIDLYAHRAQNTLENQRQYFGEVIDEAIGLVLAHYLEEGVLDNTYVVFISDHGHTPVLNDDEHALATEGDDEPPAVLEQVGFRVRDFRLDASAVDDDFQAVLAYQGAMAYAYLADRSTCPDDGDECDWDRAPRFEEDVLPVADAFWQASRTGKYVPEMQGTVDLVLARRPVPPGEVTRPYQVYDGKKLVPVDEYLAVHEFAQYVDLEKRLTALSSGPWGHRAGDVLLIARSGMSRPLEQRYYFSHPYRSWHGSPEKQDSAIPFMVAHTGSTGAQLRQRMRSVVGEQASHLDFTPLVLDLLGLEGR